MERQNLVYITKKTHAIFNGLSKKDLALIAASPPGRTDTVSYVTVPIEDPEADLILKHEWSHVFFKTNLFALDAFARQMGEDLERKYGVPKETGIEAVYAVSNALDDLRCNSLWAIIYPDSAANIAARWSRIAETHPATHLIVRIIGLGTGLHTPRRGAFDTLAMAAIQKVQRRGYTAVLAACKDLVEAYVQATAGPPNPELYVPASPEQTTTIAPQQRKARAAVDDLIAQRGKAKFLDTDSRPRGNDPDPERTARMVSTALLSNTGPTEIEASLEAEGEEVRAVASQLAEHRMIVSEDSKLLEGMSSVAFVDFKPSQVSRSLLGDRDFDTVATLRAVFARTLGERRRRRVDEGSDLDPERYIDMCLKTDDVDIFRDDAVARGFYAMVLLDFSGSMVSRWAIVSRACQVLADALTYPFVKLEVWGFSSGSDGFSEIYRFTEPKAGIVPKVPAPRMWGLTPIHAVLPIAVRHAERGRGHRHIFLLSDGTPMLLSATPSELRGSVARTRDLAMRRGVHLSTLLIGNTTPAPVADALYGQRRWVRVEDNQFSLFDEMVDLVSRTFTTFIKKGR